METYKSIAAIEASSASAWRTWLKKNHDVERSVWLIIYRKESGIPSVYYPEAVDEALCFGWVDSKPNKRDNKSYYQFFSKRNPKSNWSKVNKEKVARLMDAGRMAPAGIEMIRIAKQNGTWTALDAVEDLVVPEDLSKAFDKKPMAFRNWEQFPRSVKRGILEQLLNAKKAETRAARIRNIVDAAATADIHVFIRCIVLLNRWDSPVNSIMRANSSGRLSVSSPRNA